MPLPLFGYRLSPADRHVLFGEAAQVFWLKITVTLMFLVGLALSAPLWIGPRTYPPAPVFDLIPAAAPWFERILFAATLGAATMILVSPRPQKFIGIFLGAIGIFCLLDQTRWQPWVYQYGFLLAALALFSWERDDADGRTRALNIARLIVASTYLFSGLQKINPNFIHNDFPWVMQPLTDLLPGAAYPVQWLALAVPFIQVGFAIGLLTTRFRRLSLFLAIAMHLLILAMFGPFGHNWNSVIWPWTAAMAVLDILLFAGTEKFSLRELVWARGRAFHAATLALFAILPALSFFNCWDSYLSSALYSGNVTDAQIYTSDAGKASLPPPIARHLVRTSPDTNILNIQQWAIEDLNVTPYPETRVYKAIARDVCHRLQDPTQLVLIVREQRMFRSKPETGYRCWDL